MTLYRMLRLSFTSSFAAAALYNAFMQPTCQNIAIRYSCKSFLPEGARSRWRASMTCTVCPQGKSTLANRLLGRERVLTGPEPGLTRDAVRDEFRWEGHHIVLVDTAGWAPLSNLPTEDPG